MAKNLYHTHEALGLIPALQKQDVVSHTCDPSTQEMKAGGSGGVRQEGRSTSVGWVVSSKNVSGELMRSQSRIRGRAFQAEPTASKEVLRLEQVWQGLPMQLGCGEQADSGLRYSERNG